MNLKKLSLHIAKSFKEVFFPEKCLVCGSWIQTSSKPEGKEKVDYMYSYLCRLCKKDIVPVKSPICTKCGIMFQGRQGEDHICGRCIKSPKNFRMARSFGVYDKALMDIIHCFKYKGKIQLARPLGEILFSAFMRHWESEKIDLVLPVPLHIKRFKRRGFNQAFLLIRNWPKIAESLSINFPHTKIYKDILTKNRWTEPQTGLGRKKRMENIKNAFKLNSSAFITGKKILLVDDVFTTGSTADECAKILLRGGASQVDVLTLAQAI